MLTARFYPVLGGTEKQALSLAKQLRSTGVEVTVVTARLPGLKRKEHVDNIPVERLFSVFKGRFGSLLFMASATLYLWRRKEDYDLIHVYLAGSPGVTAGYIARRLKKKVILKFGGAGRTGDIGTSAKAPWGQWKLDFLKQNVHAFVVPSWDVKKELLDSGFPEEKIILIPNGVDTGVFQPADEGKKANRRAELKLPAGPLVIYHGRLEEGKGLEVLLSAWEEVYKQFPDAHLALVGAGNLRSRLQAGLAGKPHQGQVLFVASTDRVEAYLQAADIFVLPSLAEGLSNALLEAMSSGLAVVASEIGSNCAVVVNSVNGLLAVPGDAHALARKIIFLLHTPAEQRRLGAAARLTITDNYSIENISGKYQEIYHQLRERGSVA